jgi:hypothetical protein
MTWLYGLRYAFLILLLLVTGAFVAWAVYRDA